MSKAWDCKTCKWLYADGTCDSCGYGYPTATDNNGKKPEEVTYCNIYIKETK